MKRQIEQQMYNSAKYWNIYDGTELNDVINHLQKWLDEGCVRIDFAIDGDDDELISMTPVIIREETDKEYDKRIAGEKYWKEVAEQRDRETYEKLKAKYENKEN
jgi:hypothetical protein